MNLVHQLVVIGAARIIRIIACNDQLDLFIVQLVNQPDSSFDSFSSDNAGDLEQQNILLFIPEVLGQVLIASGDVDNARLFLEEAMSLWSDADGEFRYLQQAEEALASLAP